MVLFPEKLEITSSVTSEARFLRRQWPHTFVVGRPMRIEGKVENIGGTQMPSRDPSEGGGWWNLEIRVSWADGRVTTHDSRFQKPLQAGERVQFGPVLPTVVAAGLFRVELRHPQDDVTMSPDGKSGAGSYGSEDVLLREAVAVDMNSIYTKWGFWATVTTLGLVIVGLLLGFR